jgi:hypothetical protein
MGGNNGVDWSGLVVMTGLRSMVSVRINMVMMSWGDHDNGK